MITDPGSASRSLASYLESSLTRLTWTGHFWSSDPACCCASKPLLVGQPAYLPANYCHQSAHSPPVVHLLKGNTAQRDVSAARRQVLYIITSRCT